MYSCVWKVKNEGQFSILSKNTIKIRIVSLSCNHMLPQSVFLRLTILFYRSQRIWERKKKITGETLIRKNRSLRAYGLRETPYIYKKIQKISLFSILLQNEWNFIPLPLPRKKNYSSSFTRNISSLFVNFIFYLFR